MKMFHDFLKELCEQLYPEQLYPEPSSVIKDATSIPPHPSKSQCHVNS